MPDHPIDRYEAGLATRRRVLGEAHVARAEAATGPFDAPFQQLITEGAWGSVWSREGLEPRDRSLLTLVLLAALGHWEEFAMHIRATANTGATPEEVSEALLHVAIYAGVPAGNRAFAVARETYREMGHDL
ncbi:MAG: 4-carboxymuconolactone decarboxylase [Pseudomonadota bacterium]